MRTTYSRFLALALGLTTLRFFVPYPEPPAVEPAALGPYAFRDPESILAAGGRLALSECGVFEFELIPGVSDTLAFRLEERKRELGERSRQRPPDERTRVWEIVHGVGAKTAEKLAAYIDISR